MYDLTPFSRMFCSFLAKVMLNSNSISEFIHGLLNFICSDNDYFNETSALDPTEDATVTVSMKNL